MSEALSIERAAHEAFALVARRTIELYGIRVNRVEFEWTNISKIGESGPPLLRGVVVWSQIEL